MNAVDEILKAYKTIVEIPVAWGDMDAFQHVNNAMYFRYFESARIAYFRQLEDVSVRQATGYGPILRSINCRFRIPVTYPDTLSVGARVTELQVDRFTVYHCAVSHNHGRIAAEGAGIIVAFNYREQQKMMLPQLVRERIIAHDNPPQIDEI